MKTDPILEGALARLQIGWTQIHMAEDAKGNGVMSDDDSAVAWCALGAMWAAAESSGLDLSRKADQRLYAQACYRVAFAMGCADDDYCMTIESAVSNWNDDPSRSQEDVILSFKTALYG